jgi:hypothetical protein
MLKNQRELLNQFSQRISFLRESESDGALPNRPLIRWLHPCSTKMASLLYIFSSLVKPFYELMFGRVLFKKIEKPKLKPI